MNAAAAKVAPLADQVSPLDFMLGLMADKSADPNLRFKAAAESAKYCHPKPAVGAPTDPAEGAKVIDATSEERSRLDRLRDLELKNLLGDDLSHDASAELDRLNAWADTLPPHLLGLDADDIELRRLLAEDDQKPVVVHYAPPGEHRRRIEAARAPIDVKATTPVEEPEDDREVPPEPVDDDDLDIE
jgi:hypothetical protein